MAMHPIKDDGRYTIDREFCGYPQRRYVARFCGEWIGQDQYHSGAIMLCIAHYDAREAKTKARLGSRLLWLVRWPQRETA